MTVRKDRVANESSGKNNAREDISKEVDNHICQSARSL